MIMAYGVILKAIIGLALTRAFWRVPALRGVSSVSAGGSLMVKSQPLDPSVLSVPKFRFG